ncbi:sensor histidine kinase [Diaminobutyricimonas sp. LJ205]|uniref:sensor histidine kinase n=1 Tax=Diaminobutyricimonas sp. LJ205 TaxID=2683590 RepID=UPI0012F480FA|nr:histidine kinase [Diaminobutyricimonas sp. LJ205]
MQITLKQVEPWIAPIGAGLYLMLWINAEHGRWQLNDLVAHSVVFAGFAIALALVFRLPLLSLALVVAIPALQLIDVLEPPYSTTWPTYFAAGFVALGVGLKCRGVVRYLALPLGAIASLLIALCMTVPTPWSASSWSSWTNQPGAPDIRLRDVMTLGIAAFGLYVAAWAIGVACAEVWRRSQLGQALASTTQRFDETDFELRLAQDRARISRDVHDALAHSLAVIVSQAQGAVALQDARPEVAGRALENIASVGRSALIDVRRLVERIQDDSDVTEPTATIAELDAIVAELRDTGMDVTLRTLGEPRPIDPSQELTVYRLVQESLTNALKHAGPTSEATTVLDWRGPGLAILVTSRGEEPLVEQGDVRGVGVDGMKERARLAGGWLTAEASDDGAFIVSAFIPTRDATAPASEAPTAPAAPGATTATRATDETEELANV